MDLGEAPVNPAPAGAETAIHFAIGKLEALAKAIALRLRPLRDARHVPQPV